MSGVLYIIGSGRSGSTVIERVLNSAVGLVAVGEFHALWRLPIAELLCSCGSRVPECAFWQEALRHAGIGAVELARLAVLEGQVVRNKYLMRLGYDLGRIAGDAGIAEFAALQERLFVGVRAASGAHVVLDSSKAGPRAWVLAAAMSPVMLHLYRGAEDVIASWRRPKFEPATNAPMKKLAIREAAVDWVKVEQAARSLGKVAEIVRIDYNAFSRSPRKALGEALAPKFPTLVDDVAWVGENAVRPAQSYHSVLGNPDRFDRKDIVITPQRASDRSRLGRIEQLMIQSVGKGLERLYR